jgi:coenzyme F420-reducing hydrogenase gamma subunit
MIGARKKVLLMPLTTISQRVQHNEVRHEYKIHYELGIGGGVWCGAACPRPGKTCRVSSCRGKAGACGDGME